MTKEDNNLAVIIVVSSNVIIMTIFEKKKGTIKKLDNLSIDLNLGRETFIEGKISFENVETICSVIDGFLEVAAEYGAKAEDIKAIGTTALREAENRNYILDQIKIKTGVSLEVVDDQTEKLYCFKLMEYYCEPKHRESCLMVSIGSGSIGVLKYIEGRTPYYNNLKLGTLRINEFFNSLELEHAEITEVINEYIDTFTQILKPINQNKANYFITSGHEISLIAQLCHIDSHQQFYSIPKQNFLNFYQGIRDKSVEQIGMDYDITTDKASILLVASSVYNKILSVTNADGIIGTNYDMLDGLALELLFPAEFAKISKEFNKNNLSALKILAKKYGVNEMHYELVDSFAVKIFDKMKKIHGMGAYEKNILRSACILHDIGKFINQKQHYEHSYNIIKSLDIVNLDSNSINILANVAKYHSRITPSYNDYSYSILDTKTQVLISKLAAILRIADSLDRTNKQKFSDIEVKLTKDEIIIVVESGLNISMEEWAFNSKSQFFKEVFGITPVLKKKRVM